MDRRKQRIAFFQRRYDETTRPGLKAEYGRVLEELVAAGDAMDRLVEALEEQSSIAQVDLGELSDHLVRVARDIAAEGDALAAEEAGPGSDAEALQQRRDRYLARSQSMQGLLDSLLFTWIALAPLLRGHEARELCKDLDRALALEEQDLRSETARTVLSSLVSQALGPLAAAAELANAIHRLERLEFEWSDVAELHHAYIELYRLGIETARHAAIGHEYRVRTDTLRARGLIQGVAAATNRLIAEALVDRSLEGLIELQDSLRDEARQLQRESQKAMSELTSLQQEDLNLMETGVFPDADRLAAERRLLDIAYRPVSPLLREELRQVRDEIRRRTPD